VFWKTGLECRNCGGGKRWGGIRGYRVQDRAVERGGDVLVFLFFVFSLFSVFLCASLAVEISLSV